MFFLFSNRWRTLFLGLWLLSASISCSNLDCVYETLDQTYTKPVGKFNFCELKSFSGFEGYNETLEADQDQNELVDMVRVSYPVVMKKIHKDLFDNFDNLRYLVIYATDLQDIGQHDFEDADDLTYLRIHTNAIRELRDNIFKKANKLRYINLSYNQIEIVHNDTFTGLDLLEEVHLNNNRLSMINSHTFSNIPKLIVINLKNNLCIKEKIIRDLTEIVKAKDPEVEREKQDVELETLLVKRKCHKNYMEETVYRSAGDILVPALLTFTTLAIL